MGNLTGWGDWKGIGRWGWSGNGVQVVEEMWELTVEEELQRNELECRNAKSESQ